MYSITTIGTHQTQTVSRAQIIMIICMYNLAFRIQKHISSDAGDLHCVHLHFTITHLT